MLRFQFQPYSAVFGFSGEWFHCCNIHRTWTYNLYLGPIRLGWLRDKEVEVWDESNNKWITEAQLKEEGEINGPRE